MRHEGYPPRGAAQRDAVAAVTLRRHQVVPAIDSLADRGLALQLLSLRASESMGNHDSNVVGAGRVG